MTNSDDLSPQERADKLKKIITRVQNLLARADHPNTGAIEAAESRKIAEKYMRAWRLEEENLLARDPFSITPVSHTLFIAGPESEFHLELFSLMRHICHHSEVWEYTQWGKMNQEMRYGMYVTLVGFEVDIRQAEWLWSSARLAFSNNLEPTKDDMLSDQENVYRMRRAGMLRKDIAMLMWGQNTPAMRTKAQRLYIRECTARGEQPQLEGMGTDAKTFRSAYARSFVERVQRRLREARDAADSNGGVIVLAGRAEKVREAFYEMFPELRPQPLPDKVEDKPAKKEKPYRITKADERRIDRLYYSQAAQAGQAEGHKAANEVEISRPDPTKRIEGPDA